MDITSDITSLTAFKRRHKELCQHLRETGRPMVLTVNGVASLVVLDAQAWQQAQNRIEKLEELVGLKRSLDQALADKASDARTFFDALETTS